MTHFGGGMHGGNYRPDVDGLRALAVLLVIANHFSPAFAPGGFVGVDIFFVISGFVVTRSILQSSSGDVWKDLVHFWRRRFFRIFPVLVFFVAVTLLAISIFTAPYPPVPYNGNIRAGLSSLVGLSNIYIYRIGLDYFQDGAQNAFIHTWSLGVEEQFYLFYSILFIAVPHLLKRRAIVRSRVAALSGLGLLSFGLFLYGVRDAPMLAYYFLPHRFWELASGGLIALAPPTLLRAKRFPVLTAALQVMAAGGLLFIAVARIDTDGSQLFRIPFAVFATAVLIVTGARSGALVASVLALRPVVFVGLISYSLYLWHWPVLLLFRSTIGLANPFTVATALLQMTIMAIASWWFIERPWRRARRPVLIAPYLAGLGALVTELAFISQLAPGRLYAGNRQDWTHDWMPPANFAWLGNGRVTADACMLSNGTAPPMRVPEQCTSWRAVSGGPMVLIIGDSLAAANWPMAAFGEQRGAFRVATLAHSGCSIEGAPEVQAPSCSRYWLQAPSLVRSSLGPGDVAFVVTLWSVTNMSPSGPAAMRIAAIRDAARSVGATTVVQAPLPHFARSTYTCTTEWFRSDYSGCSVPRARLEPERTDVLHMLSHLGATEPGVRVWDPFPRLCPGETCSPFANGRPLFRDHTHLAAYGASQLGPEFVEFIRRGRSAAP